MDFLNLMMVGLGLGLAWLFLTFFVHTALTNRKPKMGDDERMFYSLFWPFVLLYLIVGPLLKVVVNVAGAFLTAWFGIAETLAMGFFPPKKKAQRKGTKKKAKK
ncbi:hypothetical protein HY502_00285 [Candidatus Woesebacteria bacterium]|nr:hypothetical protein [Candidatus Woesebacteria bacterium]